jgi:hypothetical protein
MLYRGDDPIQDRSTKNRPVFGLSSSFGEPQIKVLCKTNGCISKPPYIGFASMELREYLINLCGNAGMATEKHFHEALEFALMGEEI